ncbi:MAG: HAMP domain-containing methyl-accepting chemotaxis protein [Pseudomonadota bacterium]
MSSLDHQFGGANIQEASLAHDDASAGNGARSWFDKFSVAAKIRIGIVSNILVLIVLASVMMGGTWMLASMGKQQAVITSVEVRTGNAAIAMVDVVNALRDDDPQAFGANLANAKANLDLAERTLFDPIEYAGEDMPPELGVKVQDFLERTRALRDRLPRAERDEAARQRLFEQADRLYTDISLFSVELHPVAAGQGDRLFETISTFLLSFAICVAAGIAISVIAARLVIRNVAGRMHKITSAMKLIADGQTETHIPGTYRKDEIGDMARALSVFRSSSLALRDLTAERASDAENRLASEQAANAEAKALRAEQSALLGDLARGFEISVGEVIASVQSAADNLRGTSTTMVTLAKDSVGQSSEATDAMEAATRNVTAAAAATDEFALSISEISRQATASASLAREASTLVGAANTKMTDLSQAAQEIGEIANLIQTIAQRTNLLALNASIEAARGGEAGRGFAVVASEVKELANQTSHATSSVAEKIAAMQSSTQASASDLNSIVEQISKLEEASVVIATAVDQQSLSGEDLARNIDTVAAGSSEVSNRLVNLKKASHATGDAAGEVLTSAETLGKQADTLQAKAGQFISDVQRASRDTGMHSDADTPPVKALG